LGGRSKNLIRFFGGKESWIFSNTQNYIALASLPLLAFSGSHNESFPNDYDHEPVLFHLRIERTPCLPMVAPGQPLDNMILVDEEFEVDKSAAPS
jgi:hypothetical protein